MKQYQHLKTPGSNVWQIWEDIGAFVINVQYHQRLTHLRMTIEDDDIRDREVWTLVSRLWYSKASSIASDKIGRLYHHLAILANPHSLQQLFYYTKPLCVEIPFTSARESIMTLRSRWNHVVHDGRHSREHKEYSLHALPKASTRDDLISAKRPLFNYWSSNEKIDDDEKHFELPTMRDGRKEGILWHKFLDRSISALKSFTLPALLPHFIHSASASPAQDSHDTRDGSLYNSLAFNVVWYISLFLVAVGYIILSYHHHDRWSFLGLGMGISAWTYLVMVLVGDVPLDVIVR